MWPDAGETQSLLERARASDKEAAEKLWERFRPALRRMIGLRLDQALARRVDASDVVQDVLMKANQRLGEYLDNPAMPFHLWLRQIARDQMIDAHRRHRVSGKRSIDREQGIHLGSAWDDRSSLDLAQELQDAALTPAAEALRRELEQRFEAALHDLDDDDREIIVLRHHEQLSNIEASVVLGLSQPAAGMRYLRALKRLRERLSEPPSVTVAHP